MSDPKHPAKLVIVLRGGMVDIVFIDKKVPLRVFVADYDLDIKNTDQKDAKGQERWLSEEGAVLDTAAVRNILNKRATTKRSERGE